MFIGHYSVSFAVRAINKTIPLWVLFVAVQLVDVFWALFVMAGIERVRIVPGITASNPLDLYYMPYTHSLVSAFAWVLLGYLAYRFVRARTPGVAVAAILIGAAVFSHWILDLVVHRPDLPIYDDTMKVGLGLWNFPAVAFALEAGLMFGGVGWYLKSTTATTFSGKYGFLIFGLGMVGLQSSVFFGAPPPTPAAAAVTALFAYVVLAAIAYWLEKKRR